MTRPGDRLRAFAAALFDAQTMERVIDPALADLQAERRGVAGYVAVVKVISVCAAGGSMNTFDVWSHDERRIAGRAVWIGVIALALFTLLVAWPPFRFGGLADHGDSWHLALTLLPFAMGLSIPMALTFGIALGLGGHDVSRKLFTAVAAAAVVCSVAALVNAGWLAPLANPTLPASGAVRLTSPAQQRMLETANAVRWSMACASIPLAAFMLSVVGWPLMRRWFAGISALVAVVGYYGASNFGRSMVLAGDVPAVVGAWMPNVVFVALATWLFAISARRRRDPRGLGAS